MKLELLKSKGDGGLVSQLDICLGSGLTSFANQNRKEVNWKEMAREREREDIAMKPLQPSTGHGKAT